MKLLYKIRRKLFVILSLSVLSLAASAQQPASQSTPVKKDSITTDNQMDIFDVVKKIFKKKNLAPKKETTRNGPFFTAIPYPTYAIATGIAGAFPVNISFYINPKKYKGNFSFFNNMFEYTQYKQTIAFSISNLYFDHDRWELVGDWRFYDFPSYTYGLGTTTSITQPHQINYSYLRVYELVMRRVAKHLDAGIGYHLDYRWGIEDLDAEKGIVTDFLLYGLNKKSTSAGFSVNLLYDSRNSVNNTREGTYFNFQVRANLKPVGSNTNWNSMTIDARQYVPLPTKKWKTMLAFWGYMWMTLNGTPPYLDLPSTGWDTYNNTGRGYAMGRFRGTNMLYMETEFRFGIMKNGLLGGAVFSNLQTVSEWPGNYFGPFQPGVGMGLRLKINKRTDTNSAIDFGFGTHGSSGFSFNLNEVF